MEKVFLKKKDEEDSLYTTVEWSPRHSKWKRARFQTLCIIYYYLFKKIAYANSRRTHITRDSGSSKEKNKGGREGDFAFYMLLSLLNFEEMNIVPYKIIFKNCKCHGTSWTYRGENVGRDCRREEGFS